MSENEKETEGLTMHDLDAAQDAGAVADAVAKDPLAVGALRRLAEHCQEDGGLQWVLANLPERREADALPLETTEALMKLQDALRGVDKAIAKMTGIPF